MARKAWEELTPTYRARLERQGVTASSHASADLTRARGHVSTRVTGAAPREMAEAAARGDLTPEELRALPRYFTWPTWLPKTATRQQVAGATFPITNDVAAALSRLPDPRTWKGVELIPRGDGQPWTMTVEVRGRKRPREIEIPGGGWAGSGAKEILEILTMIRDGDLAKTKRRQMAAIFLEVMGSA